MSRRLILIIINLRYISCCCFFVQCFFSVYYRQLFICRCPMAVCKLWKLLVFLGIVAWPERVWECERNRIYDERWKVSYTQVTYELMDKLISHIIIIIFLFGSQTEPPRITRTNAFHGIDIDFQDISIPCVPHHAFGIRSKLNRGNQVYRLGPSPGDWQTKCLYSNILIR